jgi:hypothetical protein
MNLFTGMSHDQILSFFIVLGIGVACVGFYMASKPVQGRVGTAGIWHILAILCFMFATVTLVWAAPAEKSFFDDAQRTGAMIDGFISAAIGILLIALGSYLGMARIKAAAD